MGSRAARPLLLALLLALQGRGARALSYWSTVPASGAVVISDSYVVDSALAVAPGATLTIEGDLAACAGPCYVNALGASQIATVGAGASLTLKYLVLLNGTSALPGGALAGAAGSSITLVGAYVGVSKSAGAGGCIYTAGALSLYATTLQYCQSAVDGGGAWVGGALYIGAASTVSSNLAYGSGGGVVAAGGLTVDSSAFDGNYAGLLGGGIYNLLLPMTVSGSTIDNSFTVGGGGAVYSNGDAAFADSNFTNNDGGAGGGVLLLNAPATAFSAERCVFTSNYASDVGGALFLRPLFSCNDTACSQLGNLTLADCLFELNFVTLGGAAAVYVYDPAALVVTRCAFNRNKGKDLGAGAIYARGGTADISLSSFTGNLGASSVNSQGGAVTLLGDFPCSARVADCTFDGNIVFAPDVSRALLGNDIVHAPMDLEVGQGAGGGMLVKNNFATSTMAVTIERCTFTGNQASAGGGAIAAMKRAGCAMDLTVLDSVFSGNQAGHGAAVESFINATFSNCSFAGNSATNGGAINLVDVGTTSFVGGSVTGNAASFAGAAFQVGGTHSLTLSGALIADNVALAGAFIALASPTQSVALAGLTVRNNSAYAGALYYASAPLAAPTCSGCTMAANSAASYGPVIASLPASFNTTSSSFAARSGEPLQPAITVQVFDAFGQAVLNWPDLLITVAAAPPENGLSGGAAVYYANGAATLNQLSIVDQVGSNYTLVYKLTCPELLLLNSSVAGATAALDATVEPCFPLERYDARSQRCFCAPGAALLNGDCACTYGTYATPGGGDAEGQESCVPCPEGAVCLGPYPPLAMEDWWHEPGNREVFYSCHRRACMAEQPATYASSYDNCQAGHEGPLCGMCSKGYTFRGDYCLPCETGEAYAEWSSTKRGGMAFGAAFAFFVGSVTIMLYPLFPEVNARLTGMVDQRVGANAMTRVVRLLSRLAPHIVVAISSLQIVSSFSRTTEVAWPRVLYYIMNALSLLNLNVLRIPSAACATPNVNYLNLFNGITLGIFGFASYMCVMWAIGAAYAHAAMLPKDAAAHFNRTTCSRVLLFLDVVYAPMSQAIVGMFRCKEIGGSSWLFQDLSVQCFTARHMRYWDAAVFWVIFFSLGVPVLFLALLLYYRVPVAARVLRTQALLRQLVEHAQQRGVLLMLLDVPLAQLTAADVSDEQLDILFHDAFGGGESRASETKLAPAADEEGAEAVACRRPSVDDDAADVDSFAPTAKGMSREAKLERLLSWSARKLGQPRCCAWATLRPDQDPRRKGAHEAVGGLFAHYHPSRWYWKLVEVVHRFLLTCVLSFIMPGMGGQVASGICISLFMVLLYSFMLPHADAAVGRSAYNAHLVILLLFFTGLLIKLHVRFTPHDSTFYGTVVGVLVVSLFVVPALVAAHASGLHAVCLRRMRRMRRGSD